MDAVLTANWFTDVWRFLKDIRTFIQDKISRDVRTTRRDLLKTQV